MEADDYYNKAEGLATKHWYDYIYDTTDKYTVFISNNIYSYGDILFKIKKTGTDFSVFNNLFNNIFS